MGPVSAAGEQRPPRPFGGIDAEHEPPEPEVSRRGCLVALLVSLLVWVTLTLAAYGLWELVRALLD